jgi:hypothetical protein
MSPDMAVSLLVAAPSVSLDPASCCAQDDIPLSGKRSQRNGILKKRANYLESGKSTTTLIVESGSCGCGRPSTE